MLYNTGTIAINGNTATGTGTNWTAPASQVRAGQTIIVMSNPVPVVPDFIRKQRHVNDGYACRFPCAERPEIWNSCVGHYLG